MKQSEVRRLHNSNPLDSIKATLAFSGFYILLGAMQQYETYKNLRDEEVILMHELRDKLQ